MNQVLSKPVQSQNLEKVLLRLDYPRLERENQEEE